MVETVVIGTGWHAPLFRLEAAALLDSATFIHPHALVVPDAAPMLAASSLVAEALSPGGVCPLEDVASAFLALGLTGTVAVRAGRTGDKVEGWSSRRVSGEIGGQLVEAGVSIDLTSPDHVLRVQLLANSAHPVHPDTMVTEPVVVWGLAVHEGDDWSARTAPNRPFFKPVSLDPKLARAMVNLACPNGGRLLDPFCGTGGLIVEGVLRGLDCCGSDLAWPMVTGTRENAAWAQERGGEGGFEVRHGSALDLSSVWEGPFDGFAFDPPYGRNAWKSADGFDLLEGALRECAGLSHEGSRLVTLIPWDPAHLTSLEEGTAFGRSFIALTSAFEETGWQVMETTPIRVHRSLARLLVVAEKR